jgi:hypothetical protein
MTETTRKIILIVFIIGIITSIVSLSTNYWGDGVVGKYKFNSEINVQSNIGLWKICYNLNSLSGQKIKNINCDNLPLDLVNFPKKSLYTIRTFAILSVILFCVSIYYMYFYPEYLVGKILYLLTILSCLIVLITWAVKFKSLSLRDESDIVIKYKLGYSYYLNIIFMICIFISLMIIIVKK